jgi:hypothetical protein
MFPDPRIEVAPAVSDEEIRAHVVRLLRSDNFSSGQQILDALAKAFPGEESDRIRICAQAAAIKMAAQHEGNRMFVNGRMVVIPSE